MSDLKAEVCACRAVELGEQEAAETLMQHGADPLTTCHRAEDETTPVHKAFDLGNVAFVKRFTELYARSLKEGRITLQTACNGVVPLLR